jgi:hypothetical protein
MVSSRDKIQEWLSPPDPSTNLNKAQNLCHKGSGMWLLNSKEYSSWETEQESFLWLHGIPGCGKTVLSSTVIGALETVHLDANILFFFFDFTDTSKQTLENMVRSLLWQLYVKQEHTRKTLDSLYSSYKSGGRQPDINSLCKAVQEMVNNMDETWIVLDALDECHGQQELLLWIDDFRNSSVNLHILATSRPEQEIQKTIEAWTSYTDIPLESCVVEDDIRNYIMSKVKLSREFERWHSRPDIQQEIEKSLMEKANGM